MELITREELRSRWAEEVKETIKQLERLTEGYSNYYFLYIVRNTMLSKQIIYEKYNKEYFLNLQEYGMKFKKTIEHLLELHANNFKLLKFTVEYKPSYFDKHPYLTTGFNYDYIRNTMPPNNSIHFVFADVEEDKIFKGKEAYDIVINRIDTNLEKVQKMIDFFDKKIEFNGNWAESVWWIEEPIESIYNKDSNTNTNSNSNSNNTTASQKKATVRKIKINENDNH